MLAVVLVPFVDDTFVVPFAFRRAVETFRWAERLAHHSAEV